MGGFKKFTRKLCKPLESLAKKTLNSLSKRGVLAFGYDSSGLSMSYTGGSTNIREHISPGESDDIQVRQINQQLNYVLLYVETYYKEPKILRLSPIQRTQLLETATLLVLCGFCEPDVGAINMAFSNCFKQQISQHLRYVLEYMETYYKVANILSLTPHEKEALIATAEDLVLHNKCAPDTEAINMAHRELFS